MKNFFKTTLAVFVALVLFSIVSVIVSISMLGAIGSMSSAETTLQDNSVLRINLTGSLTERVNEDGLEYLLAQANNQPTPLGLNDLRSALDKAATSDQIEGVYLNCGSLSASPASAQELRSLLENFKTESGKPKPINDAKISTIIDPIEIISRGPSDTIDLQNNRRQINQNIIIQSFDSGLYAIPPILYIANKDSFKSNELALKVIPVPVDSMATINGQACVLDPNTRWYDYLPDFITDYWGWILLAIIIILGAIFYYITRKKEVSIPLIPRKRPIPPHELAMQQLSVLKEAKLCERGQEKEFYTRLTDILRVYIDTRFGINAMEMTSSQIIEALNGNDVSKEPNRYMKQILEIADFVKFAKVRPLPEDNTKSFNWATQFVVDTKPIEHQDSEKEMQKDTVKLND